MTSAYEVQTQQEAILVTSSLKVMNATCKCSYDWCGDFLNKRDFLPRFRVTKDSKGYAVEVWYVCAKCGRTR